MAQSGDLYNIEIQEVHMNWGTKRWTQNREPVAGEGYIPIPAQKAKLFDIFNSNALKSTDPKTSEKLGVNLFDCYDLNGFVGKVKATGTSQAGDIYAKQFSGSGNLKLIGTWFQKNNISAGDWIEVSWINATQIFIKKIS
mgnify:CR=1 FL=1